MNEPCLIVADSFQNAWQCAIKHLQNRSWSTWNLIVYIEDAKIFDYALHSEISNFMLQNHLLKPKTVAYTIFPYVLYKSKIDRILLYKRYQRYFSNVRKKITWGTYFERMINYRSVKGVVNQLENVITAINRRNKLNSTSFTIVIEYPGSETIKHRGGPCLNYIAIQIDLSARRINMCATYRNHDFLARAYGNYLGLCKLLQFISNETGFNCGSLTCYSSHAYVPNRKKALMQLIG